MFETNTAVLVAVTIVETQMGRSERLTTLSSQEAMQ